MLAKIDIQGHRGCRGLYPENTIDGFLHAANLGVTTLEMDVVITKDRKVLVSHEPWLNTEICFCSNGKPLDKEALKYNLFKMDYAEILVYDCGINGHPGFIKQKKIPANKPLLADVIDFTESFCISSERRPLYYNIETKCKPEGDGIYHPGPEEFSLLLYEVLKQKRIIERCYIQSFDYRTLEFLKKHDPTLSLIMLADRSSRMEEKLSQVSFKPDVYSPHFASVDHKMVHMCHLSNIKIIPWTVNVPSDMIQLVESGVDGFITDYPDLALQYFEAL